MMNGHQKVKANAKRERLEARVSSEQKDLFLRAATLQGRTLSDFMVQTLQDAAIRTIRDLELLVLGVQDREVFIEALLHAPAPNHALREAVADYNRGIGA